MKPKERSANIEQNKGKQTKGLERTRSVSGGNQIVGRAKTPVGAKVDSVKKKIKQSKSLTVGVKKEKTEKLKVNDVNVTQSKDYTKIDVSFIL